ncbi:putative minor fimbrial subunit StfF [Serratia marcescens]|uniref:fimbrial protein n=1 Tax=Serratia marcescens TaxID=615 RepID=UPI000E1D2644|nr:fimbrial protein [Serratia marcescens]AXK22117.1 Fimbrial family protein [Serratia marcescens]MBH2526195.1 fimbrial protein [Serratia marcescens]MBH2888065.1 fimbrial protein [Serratia marcescens]MBH2998647.1 fimbrial protein [Serratia marcescens]MBH3137827.1 fimbrial protein [Serratia marcescens]
MKKLGMVCFILLGLAARSASAAENMSFKGTLREDVPCDFKDGQPINVDFETVGVNKIDGERYKKGLIVDITCPADFETPYKISYVGEQSDFDASALATNTKGLAIKARYQINSGYRDLPVGDYMGGARSSKNYLSVVLVKKPNVDLEPGVFHASASFRLEYY